MRETIIESEKYLGCSDTVYVILPENYSTDRKYTTVYYLHGLGGHPKRDIFEYGFDRTASEYGQIIVMVNGHRDSWYLDSPVQGEMQYKSYFFEMLMPYIDKIFATDKDNIFITGISMGGHGAMTLFLSSPGLFRGAGSCSGVLDLKYSGSRDLTVAAVIGPYEDGRNGNFEKFSANCNIGNLEGRDEKFIFIDCGNEDYLFDASLAFLETCRRKGIKVTALFSPGRHNGKYWHGHIYRHFKLFSEASINQK